MDILIFQNFAENFHKKKRTDKKSRFFFHLVKYVEETFACFASYGRRDTKLKYLHSCVADRRKILFGRCLFLERPYSLLFCWPLPQVVVMIVAGT